MRWWPERAWVEAGPHRRTELRPRRGGGNGMAARMCGASTSTTEARGVLTSRDVTQCIDRERQWEVYSDPLSLTLSLGCLLPSPRNPCHMHRTARVGVASSMRSVGLWWDGGTMSIALPDADADADAVTDAVTDAQCRYRWRCRCRRDRPSALLHC